MDEGMNGLDLGLLWLMIPETCSYLKKTKIINRIVRNQETQQLISLI
jgi:hypothetical protein